MPEQETLKNEIVSLLKEITGDDKLVAEKNEKGIAVKFSSPEHLAAVGIDTKNPPPSRKPNTYTFPNTKETVDALKEVLDEQRTKAEKEHTVEAKIEHTHTIEAKEEHAVKYRKPKPDDFRRPRIFRPLIGDSSSTGISPTQGRGR
jgi:hypothetical protein